MMKGLIFLIGFLLTLSSALEYCDTSLVKSSEVVKANGHYILRLQATSASIDKAILHYNVNGGEMHEVEMKLSSGLFSHKLDMSAGHDMAYFFTLHDCTTDTMCTTQLQVFCSESQAKSACPVLTSATGEVVKNEEGLYSLVFDTNSDLNVEWVDARIQINSRPNIATIRLSGLGMGRFSGDIDLAPGDILNFFFWYSVDGIECDTGVQTFAVPNPKPVCPILDKFQSEVISKGDNLYTILFNPRLDLVTQAIKKIDWIDVHISIVGGESKTLRMNSLHDKFAMDVTLMPGDTLEYFFVYMVDCVECTTGVVHFAVPKLKQKVLCPVFEKYSSELVKLDGDMYKITFHPNSDKLAQWVRVHYRINSGELQMLDLASAEGGFSGTLLIPAGSNVEYFFTYLAQIFNTKDCDFEVEECSTPLETFCSPKPKPVCPILNAYQAHVIKKDDLDENLFSIIFDTRSDHVLDSLLVRISVDGGASQILTLTSTGGTGYSADVSLTPGESLEYSFIYTIEGVECETGIAKFDLPKRKLQLDCPVFPDYLTQITKLDNDMFQISFHTNSDKLAQWVRLHYQIDQGELRVVDLVSQNEGLFTANVIVPPGSDLTYFFTYLAQVFSTKDCDTTTQECSTPRHSFCNPKPKPVCPILNDYQSQVIKSETGLSVIFDARSDMVIDSLMIRSRVDGGEWVTTNMLSLGGGRYSIDLFLTPGSSVEYSFVYTIEEVQCETGIAKFDLPKLKLQLECPVFPDFSSELVKISDELFQISFHTNSEKLAHWVRLHYRINQGELKVVDLISQGQGIFSANVIVPAGSDLSYFFTYLAQVISTKECDVETQECSTPIQSFCNPKPKPVCPILNDYQSQVVKSETGHSIIFDARSDMVIDSLMIRSRVDGGEWRTTNMLSLGGGRYGIDLSLTPGSSVEYSFIYTIEGVQCETGIAKFDLPKLKLQLECPVFPAYSSQITKLEGSSDMFQISFHTNSEKLAQWVRLRYQIDGGELKMIDLISQGQGIFAASIQVPPGSDLSYFFTYLAQITNTKDCDFETQECSTPYHSFCNPKPKPVCPILNDYQSQVIKTVDETSYSILFDSRSDHVLESLMIRLSVNGGEWETFNMISMSGGYKLDLTLTPGSSVEYAFIYRIEGVECVTGIAKFDVPKLKLQLLCPVFPEYTAEVISSGEMGLFQIDFKTNSIKLARWVKLHYESSNGEMVVVDMQPTGMLGTFRSPLISIPPGTDLNYHFTYLADVLSTNECDMITEVCSTPRHSFCNPKPKPVCPLLTDFQSQIIKKDADKFTIIFDSQSDISVEWVEVRLIINGGALSFARMLSLDGKRFMADVCLKAGDIVEYHFIYRALGMECVTGILNFSLPKPKIILSCPVFPDAVGGIVSLSDSTFQLAFSPNSDKLAQWVKVHYSINRGPLAELTLALAGNQYLSPILNLAPADTVSFHFTYLAALSGCDEVEVCTTAVQSFCVPWPLVVVAPKEPEICCPIITDYSAHIEMLSDGMCKVVFDSGSTAVEWVDAHLTINGQLKHFRMDSDRTLCTSMATCTKFNFNLAMPCKGMTISAIFSYLAGVECQTASISLQAPDC